MARSSRATAGFTGSGFDPYKLTGVTVTDRELGHGSYATVLELEYMGLKCAGKKIHELLLKQSDSMYTLLRFEEECRLLSQVRHPNIVQFLGVYFQQGVQAPILVMEFLSTNLTSCIEQFGILPKEISYSILHDVALGLCYLHSQTPPIIHRDLSSNNVLLTPNMTAKISDLGVARILNLTPLQVSRMTRTPGTPAYMPPEVMVAKPRYDTSIDIFSYGILMMHTFSGKWPEPQVGPIRARPSRLIPVSEAERRDVFLQAIGSDHPLLSLIHKCINNHPRLRPRASEIVKQLTDVLGQFPASSMANRLEMLRQIESHEEERKKFQETLTQEKQRLAKQLAEKTKALEEKDAKISQICEQLSKARDGLATKPQTIQASLAWKQCSNLPLRSSEGKAIVINDRIYYGGGTTDVDNDENEYIVCYYELAQDKWTTLPPLPVRWFGLGQVNGKLVAVGGRKKLDNRATNEIYSYNDRTHKWKQTIPPMPTARWSLSVLSLQSAAILVAGGRCTQSSNSYTDVLEVFSAETSQWYRTDPLPTPCSSVALIDIGSTCYALGGYKYLSRLNQALYASIGDLFCNAVPANQTTHGGSSGTQSAWKALPKLPINQSAAAVLSGNLLALGGKGVSSIGNRKEVYMYLPLNNSWIYFNDLPAPLFGTAVVVLSSTEILVIGGEGNENRMNTAYKGTLAFRL